MDLSLSGKNVILTGGSKGIGREICHAFLCEGANSAAETVDRLCREQRRLTLGMASPAEVANAVVFLSSPRSSFTTGTNLVIDAALTQRVDF